ncbi:type III secretion system protein SepZ [Shigella flexneri]|nr:type III secretion system protein SepZ [Escherichia coli]
MDAANLSPSGRVLPLAAAVNGNNPVDEKTGVMQAEGGGSRTVKLLGAAAIAAITLTAVGTGIAAACIGPENSEFLGLGIATGVLGATAAVGSGLVMRYA